MANTKPEATADFSPKSRNEISALISDALTQLIEENIHAPIKVCMNLDMNKYRDRCMKLNVWPENAKINLDANYDFVLFGSKIGIIVIQISTVRNDQFRDGNASMPIDYQHTLDQLESSDKLISFMNEIFHCEFPELGEYPMRKILLTPNLDKERFKNWIRSLEKEKALEILHSFTGKVTQFFRDDSKNSYGTLRNIIEKPGYEFSNAQLKNGYREICFALESMSRCNKKSRVFGKALISDTVLQKNQ